MEYFIYIKHWPIHTETMGQYYNDNSLPQIKI